MTTERTVAVFVTDSKPSCVTEEKTLRQVVSVVGGYVARRRKAGDGSCGDPKVWLDALDHVPFTTPAGRSTHEIDLTADEVDGTPRLTAASFDALGLVGVLAEGIDGTAPDAFGPVLASLESCRYAVPSPGKPDTILVLEAVPSGVREHASEALFRLITVKLAAARGGSSDEEAGPRTRKVAAGLEVDALHFDAAEATNAENRKAFEAVFGHADTRHIGCVDAIVVIDPGDPPSREGPVET